MWRRRPVFSLFPYTTLFRSGGAGRVAGAADRQPAVPEGVPDRPGRVAVAQPVPAAETADPEGRLRHQTCASAGARPLKNIRSEEHTSELQSLRHLVCRLLLENVAAPTGIFTLSLHDALPIWWCWACGWCS